MGDNPDHLAHMMRETRARTQGVHAPDLTPPQGLWARLARAIKTFFAGSPATSGVK